MLCFVFTSFFSFFFFYSCFFFFLLLHSGDKFVFYYIKNLVFMGLHEGMVFFPDFPSFNGEDKRVILQRYHKVYHSHDRRINLPFHGLWPHAVFYWLHLADAGVDVGGAGGGVLHDGQQHHECLIKPYFHFIF